MILRSKASILSGALLLSAIGTQVGCNETQFDSARVAPGAADPTGGDDATAQRPGQPGTRGYDSLDGIKKPDTMIQSFVASEILDESFSFTLAPKLVSTNFTLEDTTAAQMDAFTQVVRTPVTDSEQQGNPGTAMSETFAQQARKGLVDILVVIDNSGSMAEEQVNLASKLNELLVAIKDANWQISVITTSPAVPNGVNANDISSEGKELCQTTLIKAGDADANAKFSQAIQAGLAGNGNEQGVRQAVVGLRCTERPWVRPTATLAVLIVSDEDNCSTDGSGCGALPWAKESYLIQYVENTLKRTIGTNAGIYGIIGPSKALCPTTGNAGTQYIRLFQHKAPQGVLNYGNICDANYTSTLNRISSSIALLLNQQFELKAVPDLNSLKLTQMLQGGGSEAIAPSRFQQTGKVITFVAGQEPPAGSTVKADYLTGAVPMRKAFSLKQDPAPETLTVKVNGVTQAPGSYSLSGRTVTFSQEPAAMAALAFDYRVLAPSLLSRFKPTAEGVPGTFKVAIDGKDTPEFTYNNSTKEIELKKAPLDGQKVAVSYSRRVGPRLSYTLPMAPDAEAVRIVDSQEALIPFTRQNGIFTIEPSVHQVGKVLQLRYEIPDGALKIFDLGQDIVDGSATLTSNKAACTMGQGFEVKNGSLMSTCLVNERVDFILSYKHEVAQRSFKFDGVVDPEKGIWSVLIDGVATEDYVRNGSEFTLSFNPPASAKVEIHYTLPE